MRSKLEILKRIDEYQSIRKNLLKLNKPRKAYYYFNLISLLEWVLYSEE